MTTRSATWPWTDAERIEALGDPTAAGSRSPSQDAQDFQGGQDAEVEDDRAVAGAVGGGLHGGEVPGRRGVADDRQVAGSGAGIEDLTPVDPGGAGADRTMADPGEVPYEPTLVSQHVPSPPAPDDGNDDNTALDPDDDAPEHDDSTTPDRGTAGEDLTMADPPEELEEPEEMVNNATMLDPLDSSAGPAKNATYVDWIDGTLSDAGPIPLVAPSPVTPGPPRTRMLDEQVQDPARPPDPPPPQHPGTRIMSGTMVGGLLGVAPMPDKPVEQIAPPRPAPMPKVAERFGIRFLSGIDDATELFDGLRRKASADPPVPPPALLIVGDPHTGQRRLTRLIARTLAGAGVGDGSVRTADGSELRGDHAATVTAILRGGGPPLLFERLDRAILDAADPDRVVAAVTRARADKTVLIATATPDSYTRLTGRYPGLAREFEVFRLPDLSGPGTRLALLHVLADERRVTINASGLDVVRGDLARLAGYGDLVGARLVEAYLDRAVSRHTEREGAPRDRMVLQPVDFAGVAEDIEPCCARRATSTASCAGSSEMIGLDEVKHTVGGLVAEARMAADRTRAGCRPETPAGT